jgi:tetratricopeptide (TPR) repeat protein
MENMAKEILANSQNNTLAKKYLDIALNKKSEFSILEDNLAKKPSAEGYLDLSLKYYNIENYDKTILAAKKALEINKNLAGAYNNIGIGYFKLKDYEKAYEAYNNAIRISPDYTLAQNNLKELLIYKEKNEALQEELRQLSTSEELLNFSLKCYNEEAYLLCIEAATKSNSIKKSTFAYNNICAAYNKLGKFNNAIEACNKALEIDRSNSYAKGNLDFAILQNSLK